MYCCIRVSVDLLGHSIATENYTEANILSLRVSYNGYDPLQLRMISQLPG